ncbi:unnamed protein product, partial [Prorocentrum cordatum]
MAQTRRRAVGKGAGGPPGWPVEWTCAAIVLMALAAVWQVRHRAFGTAECTSLSGMCTPSQCGCPEPLLKQELVTQDEQPCFRCVAGFCPVVSQGGAACSSMPCECEDPKWAKVDAPVDGQPCWQCVRPSLDFTVRLGSGNDTCAARLPDAAEEAAAVEAQGDAASQQIVLKETADPAECMAFRYSGALITEKRHAHRCLVWRPFGAHWGLGKCDAHDVNMQFQELELEAPADPSAAPHVYCAGSNRSEYCVEVADRLCTEEEGRCSTERCRCEDSSWVLQELETFGSLQRCYKCTQRAQLCPTAADECSSTPSCECADPAQVRVLVSPLADHEFPCYRCELPPGAGTQVSQIFAVVALMAVGLAAGCWGSQLFFPNATETEENNVSAPAVEGRSHRLCRRRTS